MRFQALKTKLTKSFTRHEEFRWNVNNISHINTVLIGSNALVDVQRSAFLLAGC